MVRRLIAIVAIVTGVLIPERAIGETAWVDLDYEARVVLDWSRAPAKDIAVDTMASWIVVEADPDLSSGAARIGETGTGIVSEGSWRRLAVVRGSTEGPSGVYRWIDPIQSWVGHGNRTPGEIHNLFVEGGVGLCQYDPSESERPFGECYLLLPQWATVAVTEAMTFVRAHPKFLETKPERDDSKRLARLLEQDNPMLSALAFRAMTSQESWEPEKSFRHLDRYAVAIGTKRLIDPFASAKSRDRARARRLAERGTGQILEGVALGLYAGIQVDWRHRDDDVLIALLRRCEAQPTDGCDYVMTVLRELDNRSRIKSP